MTTAADGYPHRPWKQRWYEIAGHFGLAFEMGWLIGLVIQPSLPYSWSWVVLFVSLGLLIMMQRGQFVHARNLCWRCMKIVPLDPANKIKKHDRALRFVHWVHNNTKKAVLVMAAVMFVPMVAGVVLGFIIFPVPWPWFTLWYAGLFTVQFSSSYSNNRHQWLRPWCPYCRRWDDGGDHEVVPDPVPSGEREKVE